MGILSHEALLRLHERITSIGLSDEWPILLTGITSQIVASLARAATPAAQVLADLSALNELGPDSTETGEIPLEACLRNAARLAAGRGADGVFADALDEIQAALASSGDGMRRARPLHVAGLDLTTATRGADRVYVTSELWDVMVPVRCDLDEPVGIVLQRLLAILKLPKTLQHEGRVGIRLQYTLSNPQTGLRSSASLSAQGVKGGDILSLTTRASIFSAVAPLNHDPDERDSLFRGTSEPSDTLAGHAAVESLFEQLGLRTRARAPTH